MATPAPAPTGALAVAAEVGEANRAFEEGVVTLEDIQRFTVAEGLSDVERAQLYLSSGQEVQELAVVCNLPGLVRAAGRGAWTAVSRSLAELARRLDEEGQLAAAAAFATLARERLLPAVDLTDAILPLALAGANDAGGGHAAVQAAWLACLGEVCAAVEPITLHSRVLPAIATRCGGGGRALRERCLGCELLGAVAPHAGAEDLQRSVLRLAGSLCADTEWQVRHAACQLLPTLAAAAAAKLDAPAQAGVLEDVFALLEDEEALVRAAAWRALPPMLELLPADLRRTRALPLLLAQCKELDHHAEVHRSLAAAFGPLMSHLVPDMDGDADVSACLACFRSLAWRHDGATRLACAASFAAVLRAGTARRYGSHLHDTLLRLASDGDAEVRLAMAAALPDVAAVLDKDRCCQYLRQPVAALLQDERQEVQAALLGRLAEVLEQFVGPAPALVSAAAAAAARPGAGGASAAAQALAAAAATAAEEQRGKTCAPFIEPLLRLEVASGYSWRLQLALLQAIAAFPAFFTGDQLHDRFLPLALKYMAEGAAAVRAAAAAAAAAIWRALRRPAHRSALYSRLIHDFGQSKCFRQRLVFIDFCRHAQQLFSSRFLKAYLLEPVLSLAYDPVANVRLHLAAATPALKQAVTLPDDVHLLERLNSAMSHLITDGDSDVCQAARKSNEEFKRQPVRMSCGALESSPPEVKAYEAADAARAEAERDFAMDPEALDKVRADIAAYSEQLHPGSSRLALPLPGARGSGSSSGASTPGSGSRSGRPAPSAAGSLAGKLSLRPPALAAAAASGHHRSTSDGADARRDRGPAGSSLRSASAGAVGGGSAHGAAVSSGSKSLGLATSRSAAASRSASAAASHANSTAADAAGSDDGGPASHRHTFGGSSGASRLGRPAAAATPPPAAPVPARPPATAAPAKAAAPAAAGAPKLRRPSPTGAAAVGASKLSRPSPKASNKRSPSSPLATGPAAASPAAVPPSMGSAGAAGAATATAVPGRAAAAKTPAGRAPAAAAGAVGQLASKLKAGLQLHAISASPELPKAGVSQRLLDAHSTSGSGRAARPAGHASAQHGSK
ncbi:hypothetical protein ABPG75_012026 [Micractinium tetrahymenae]